MTVLFAAGGTGGHLFPAIAVARKVQEISPHATIHFAIADNGKDAEVLSHTPFAYTTFPVAKLRRYFSLENIRDFFRFFRNLWKAYTFLKELRPDIVFSKGGFVSLPLGIASKIKGIPLFLHESDSTMGLANKILERLATKVFCGFPHEKYEYTGNPVREEFFTPPPPISGRDKPLLLVIGGSQGAHVLNKWTIANAPEISKTANIILIAGPTSPLIGGDRGVTIVPFLHEDFAPTLQKADVVISRAGAGSISELSAAQKCSILVPLPSAANNHQHKNAELLAQKNAAIVWDQSQMDSPHPCKGKGTAVPNLPSLLNLLQNPKDREPYEKNIAAFTKSNAAEVLAKETLNHIVSKQGGFSPLQ